MNALQLAREHVAFHHGNADGWVTLAQKNEKGFKQFHYTAQELADHLKEWTGDDVYFSQNTFYKPQRRIDSIRQLRSLYVDLDVYNVGMDPEYALGKLEFDFFGQTIPEPNLVIFSGRGLVLVWNIDPVPYQAMPLWKALEGHFIKELAEVGADPKASDPARIFRLAGTTNSKSGTMVRTTTSTICSLITCRKSSRKKRNRADSRKWSTCSTFIRCTCPGRETSPHWWSFATARWTRTAS